MYFFLEFLWFGFSKWVYPSLFSPWMRTLRFGLKLKPFHLFLSCLLYWFKKAILEPRRYPSRSNIHCARMKTEFNAQNRPTDAGDGGVYLLSQFNTQNRHTDTGDGGVYLLSQWWEGRDRWSPQIHWSHVAEWVSSKPVREPVLRTETQGWPLASTHKCT